MIFLSLDGNPQRGNKPINAQLELLDENSNLLIKVDDSTSSSSPGEALLYRVENDGVYFARVSISPNASSANGAGDYLLSISKNGSIGIGNTPPALSRVSLPSPVYQNSPANLSGAFFDYDLGQSHQVVINWGDGSPATTTNLPPSSGSFDLSHLYTQSSPSLPVSIAVHDPANAWVSTNLTVAVVSQPARPRLVEITPSANGFLVRLQGSPGATYRIEASSDLNGWTNLTNAMADLSGFFQIEDSSSPLPSQRFYRAIWP